VALVVTSLPAQAKLGVEHIEAAYGPLLPERKALEYVSQDLIFFRYLVTGAKVDEQGNVNVEALVQLTDANGKEVSKQTLPFKGTLSLGGDSFSGSAYIVVGEQFLAGTYTLSVTLTDLLASQKVAFQREVKVRSAEFAVVFPRFSYDLEGRVLAPAGGLVNQTLHFRIGAVGFDRSQEKVDLVSHVQLLDTQGKELLPKALETIVKVDDPKVVKTTSMANFSGSLGLHRPGEFTLRITVTDRLAQKTATFEMPLRVKLP